MTVMCIKETPKGDRVSKESGKMAVNIESAGFDFDDGQVGGATGESYSDQRRRREERKHQVTNWHTGKKLA